MADARSEVRRTVALNLLACMGEQDWDRMYAQFLTDDSRGR